MKRTLAFAARCLTDALTVETQMQESHPQFATAIHHAMVRLTTANQRRN